MKTLKPILAVTAALLIATGCTRTERTLAGAGIGGAGGAVIGDAVGGSGGAVVGALAGGTAGAVVGRNTR
ncbi:YMGG-like glycine zipper-containing protein [Aureimonas mangrovi]|uniref:YMGG-like glycine zipper-containing protein n=1 Tax=Aureimonas mangrovi TaxID=2758041 RepID=UPI00163D9170|nr:glycine zipper domain-containing protein [Aureimonas mangrovi]